MLNVRPTYFIAIDMPYCAGSGASSTTTPAAGDPFSDPQSSDRDGEAPMGTTSRAVERDTILIHHPLCELHDIPGEGESRPVPPLSARARAQRRVRLDINNLLRGSAFNNR